MTPIINQPQRKEYELIEFDVILKPNTSLSPVAFLLLISIFGLVSFIAGIMFIIVGAWPVFGFLGLDVLLIYLAFKRNYRDATKTEKLWLTKSTLGVEKIYRDKKNDNYLSFDWSLS